MKVSIVLSIFNRKQLFTRGFRSIDWQTMDKNDFEVILVDDGSTDDYRDLFAKYPDLNITHIRYDHTQHPIFKELNPDFDGEGPEIWWHTPALSTNLGFRYAKGEVILITQPEIIQGPENLDKGYRYAKCGNFVFGDVWQGLENFNIRLDREIPCWELGDFPELLNQVKKLGGVNFTPACFYWYVGFLLKDACYKIHGVDEYMLRGCCGEDDHFRMRIELAGYKPVDRWDIIGIHQSHEDELDFRHNRKTEHWTKGQIQNRSFFHAFKESIYDKHKHIHESHESVYLPKYTEEWGDISFVTDVKQYGPMAEVIS